MWLLLALAAAPSFPDPPPPERALADVRTTPPATPVVVRGWISKVYACPPCPPDALCKPCMGDNVVVSPEPRVHADYTTLGKDDLIVLVDDPAPFEAGARWELVVEAAPPATDRARLVVGRPAPPRP